MCSLERSPGDLLRIVLVACLAGVLGCSAAGCSGEGGPATISPPAKQTFNKKFQDFGEKKGLKTSR
jgi:hypothetical protein